MFLTIEFAHVITSLMTECLPTGCGLMIILGDSIVVVLKQTYALERIFCGNFSQNIHLDHFLEAVAAEDACVLVHCGDDIK